MYYCQYILILVSLDCLTVGKRFVGWLKGGYQSRVVSNLQHIVLQSQPIIFTLKNYYVLNRNRLTMINIGTFQVDLHAKQTTNIYWNMFNVKLNFLIIWFYRPPAAEKWDQRNRTPHESYTPCRLGGLSYITFQKLTTGAAVKKRYFTNVRSTR